MSATHHPAHPGAQTLAKSAKALPVMLWSTLYMRKRFKLSEYLHAFCITLGCSVFILTGHVRAAAAAVCAYVSVCVCVFIRFRLLGGWRGMNGAVAGRGRYAISVW